MNAPFETELTHGFVAGRVAWIRRSSGETLLCVKNTRGTFYVDVGDVPIAALDAGHTIVVAGALYSCFRKGCEHIRLRAKTIERL